jgi:hypothetical protein
VGHPIARQDQIDPSSTSPSQLAAAGLQRFKDPNITKIKLSKAPDNILGPQRAKIERRGQRGGFISK